MRNSRTYVLIVTGLALFAMFFGAGNLIFPVMIGVNAGTSVTPAILGFLGTGVLLPMLGIIAAATSQEGVTGIASRIGKYPGLVFTIVIFLSTGMLYAIPRVATVSFEMAVVPLIDSTNPNGVPLFLYTVVFFVVTYLLALNPKGFLDRIGGWLTPALLVLLIILILTAAFRLPAVLGTPTAEYAETPFATGLLRGYFTMDAIASLVFGIVIISSLRYRGFNTKSQVFTGTAIAGVIAGVALALIYIGLTIIGTRMGPFGVDNGAEALARAATELFGTGGVALFGLIAVLACLTTAVGLTGASSQYFRTLFPQISRSVMVLIHTLVALALANLGLETILDIVAPVNQLIYPVVICVIFIALFDIFVPGQLYWTYRLAAWLGAFVGVFEALWSTNLPQFAFLRDILDVLPLGSVHMPWVTPALAGFIIGLILDTVQGDRIWTHRPEEVEKVAS